MRIRAVVSIAGILLLVLLLPQSAAAQSNDASTVIALVNQLRAEYGLPPYEVNSALMSAAQSHTDWAAANEYHSHTGAGGTTYKERMAAAGYGSINDIHAGENIYWGTGATAQTAMDWWSSSAIHLQNMTSNEFTDIGAGVASNGDVYYYTLNFANLEGGSSSGSDSGSETQPQSTDTGEQIPSGTVTNADGSVTYYVQSGDSLWGIADEFGLEIYELQELNGLAENQGIHPGDELIVSPPTGDAPASIGGEGAQPAATPRPPLYHTVVEGDTASGIAYQYGIEVGELYTLNEMNDGTVLYVGDQLLIRAGDPTHTPTPPPTEVPTVTPTASPVTPTPAATSTPIVSSAPTLTNIPTQEGESEKQGIAGPLLIGGLFGAVIVGIVIGVLLARRRPGR